MGQLYITKRTKCYFVVYAEKWLLVQEIFYDHSSSIVGRPPTTSSGRGLNVACLRIAKTPNSAFSRPLYTFRFRCSVLLIISSIFFRRRFYLFIYTNKITLNLKLFEILIIILIWLLTFSRPTFFLNHVSRIVD
jgi:hypothetical protein